MPEPPPWAKMNGSWLQRLNELIPGHMRSGVQLYIEHGAPPGGFLTAVICNDFAGAAGRADDINRSALGDYATFFYNFAPSECWGSAEKMDAWLQRHQQHREAASCSES